MVALELFRAVCNWNDMGYGRFGLHFIRTREGREVDFLLSDNRRPAARGTRRLVASRPALSPGPDFRIIAFILG